MPYSKRITRAEPTALIFLLDQSGSMKGKLGNDRNKKKCDAASDAVNHVIREFVLQSTKDYGVGDYFHIGVIGYADDALPAFGGALKGLDLVPISQVADNPLRIEERVRLESIDDGAGGLVEQSVKHRFPIWFESKADGRTTMCHALDYAYDLLKGWVNSHSDCFPPILINISDGEPTDGNPTKRAEQLKALTTSEGNVLLFDFHISSKSKGEILFPTETEKLPDRHARMLYKMSSLLTEKMIERAELNGIPAQKGSKGFGFCVNNNEVLVKLLEIGTTTAGTQ